MKLFLCSFLQEITIFSIAVKLICGSQGSGPMDITFNNSNSQKIALIYINNKPNECTFSKNGSIYSIINTRKSGCSVQVGYFPEMFLWGGGY